MRHIGFRWGLRPYCWLGFILGLSTCVPVSNGQTAWVRLPSGREIRPAAVRYFTDPKYPPFIRFIYDTKLDVDSGVALRQEAEEVWPLARDAASKYHVNQVVLLAREEPTGLLCIQRKGLCKYEAFGFALARASDGQWYYEDGSAAAR